MIVFFRLGVCCGVDFICVVVVCLCCVCFAVCFIVCVFRCCPVVVPFLLCLFWSVAGCVCCVFELCIAFVAVLMNWPGVFRVACLCACWTVVA